MVKASVERITSITPIRETGNSRSVQYQLKQESGRFQQLLENKKRAAKQPEKTGSTTPKNAPDDFIAYALYDMNAYARCETRNLMDLKG